MNYIPHVLCNILRACMILWAEAIIQYIKLNIIMFASYPPIYEELRTLWPKRILLLLINNKSPITPITLSAKPDFCAIPAIWNPKKNGTP